MDPQGKLAALSPALSCFTVASNDLDLVPVAREMESVGRRQLDSGKRSVLNDLDL